MYTCIHIYIIYKYTYRIAALSSSPWLGRPPQCLWCPQKARSRNTGADKTIKTTTDTDLPDWNQCIETSYCCRNLFWPSFCIDFDSSSLQKRGELPFGHVKLSAFTWLRSIFRHRSPPEHLDLWSCCTSIRHSSTLNRLMFYHSTGAAVLNSNDCSPKSSHFSSSKSTIKPKSWKNQGTVGADVQTSPRAHNVDPISSNTPPFPRPRVPATEAQLQC